MKKRFSRTRAALSLGLLLSLAWAGSFALFSDQASSDASFTTGSVDITASPATALFNVGNMTPGTVSYAPLTVTNSGSLGFTYVMSTSATSSDALFPLATALSVEIRKTSGACDAASWATLTGVSGPGILAGATVAARSLAASGSPGDSEILCFQVTLPSAVTNDYQGDSASATFTFTATQV